MLEFKVQPRDSHEMYIIWLNVRKKNGIQGKNK